MILIIVELIGRNWMLAARRPRVDNEITALKLLVVWGLALDFWGVERILVRYKYITTSVKFTINNKITTGNNEKTYQELEMVVKEGPFKDGSK